MPRADRTRADDAMRPPPGPALTRNLCRVLVAVVPLVAGLIYLRQGIAAQGRLGFPLDDSYIHLQFARNLATGHGWSFNPGEPTPGATSPLWVALLAALAAVQVPLET